MVKNGVVFIAAGAGFVRAANDAARSVRAVSPSVEVDIFCDSPELVERTLFDKIEAIQNAHRRSKVDYLAETRFDRTLYLDTDTRVVADITEMFEILSVFDIALAHAHARNRDDTNETWRKPLPGAFPQLNGGVILYRSTREVVDFLRKWRDAYHQSGFRKDQTTLRELLWDSQLRLYVLPPEYNLRYPKYEKVWSDEEAHPKIKHYRRFHLEAGARGSKKKWKQWLQARGLKIPSLKKIRRAASLGRS